MKKIAASIFNAALFFLLLPLAADSQIPKALFATDTVLNITLQGNIRDLLADRSETPQYHPLSVLYKNEDGTKITITAEAKTRGHFRKLKENCIYPPLQLHFSKSDTLASSIFNEQKKLKLVMPCQDDNYVVREWLIYKLYNLVTPKSFQARLVRLKIEDSKNKKDIPSFFGILLEEEDQMAKRNGAIALTLKLKPQQTEPDAFLKMTVFEYLIGNTDWSVQYLQNIKLIAADSTTVPTAVPYDFDHSGLVNAPYAKPAEELEMASVTQRRYRGYCIQDMKQFDASVDLFNRIKNDIYGVYTSCTLLDPKYVKSAIKYLDDFYKTINTPAILQKEFGYPCDKNGTGNVVIKGLRED